MPDNAPETVAMRLYTSGTFYSPIVADGDLIRDVMVAAIMADRAGVPSIDDLVDGAMQEFTVEDGDIVECSAAFVQDIIRGTLKAAGVI